MGAHKKYLTEEERREARRRSQREYYRRNQEERLAKSKEYYILNREEKLIKGREYYYKNRERNLELSKTRRKNSEVNAKILISEMMATAKSGAKRRNIEFKLTKENLEQMFIESNGVCAISGLPLSTKFNSATKVSIDRIDSSKGYTKSNVQLVAKCVNIAKSNLKQSEFIAMCKAVVAFNS